MAKKKKQNKLLRLISFGLGIGAVVMIALPALKINDSVFSGIEAAFGKSLANFGSWAKAKLSLNILLVLAYLFALLAAFASFLQKNKIIVLVLFVIAAALFLISPTITKITYELLGNTNTANVEPIKQFGLYISFSLSLIGACISAYEYMK